MVETTESRDAEVARIAEALRTSRVPAGSPDAGDRYWATLSDDEIASDLYNAGLRSTSRDSEGIALAIEDFATPMGTEDPIYLAGKQAGLALAAAIAREAGSQTLPAVEWCEAHEQENDRDRVDREECPDCQAAVGRWWWATRWTKEGTR